MKILKDQQFLNTQLKLSGTNNNATAKDDFFFNVNINMHCSAATWFSDWIVAWTCRFTGVSFKLYSECRFGNFGDCLIYYVVIHNMIHRTEASACKECKGILFTGFGHSWNTTEHQKSTLMKSEQKGKTSQKTFIFPKQFRIVTNSRLTWAKEDSPCCHAGDWVRAS